MNALADSPATIRDVARRAALSVASVSRVLNGHSNVHPDTRQRVLAAVRDLGYTPNAAARTLSTARTHAIGVVLPDLHGEFFSEMMRGMDKAASEHGYMLLLSNMHADSALASQALAALRSRVDGMVVMAPQIGAQELESALPAGKPAVLVNSPDEAGRHALRIDNYGGVKGMVRHLLDSGRRGVVHFAGPADNLDGAERRAAYCEAMATLAPDRPCRILEGDFGEASGGALARQLMAAGTPFDAIFAANDMMALGALQALRDAGVAVPDTVAVAGFDDIPLARYLGLSTVRVDMVGLGQRAIARLIDEIEERAEPPALERLTTDLIARVTTAAA